MVLVIPHGGLQCRTTIHCNHVYYYMCTKKCFQSVPACSAGFFILLGGQRMITNNENIFTRPMRFSPVCWAHHKLTQRRYINQLSATQQDIFYYLLYQARHVYETAWQRIQSVMKKQTIDGDIEISTADRYRIINASNKMIDSRYYDDKLRHRNNVWCVLAAYEGWLTIELSIYDIGRAIGYTGHTPRLINDLLIVSEINYIYPYEYPDRHLQSALFEINIHGERRHQTAVISIHPSYARDVFEKRNIDYIRQSFVAFRLWDMVQIKSKYAKILFRLMVQWDVRGKTPKYSTEHIVAIFGLSDAFRLSDIMTRIINPACNEMTDFFGVNVVAVPYYDTKDGRKLAAVSFQFPKYTYRDYETKNLFNDVINDEDAEADELPF